MCSPGLTPHVLGDLGGRISIMLSEGVSSILFGGRFTLCSRGWGERLFTFYKYRTLTSNYLRLFSARLLAELSWGFSVRFNKHYTYSVYDRVVNIKQRIS